MGPFNQSLRQGEDYDYSIRCAMHGQIGAISQILVRYRKHSTQASADFRHVDTETLAIIEGYAKKMQKHDAIIRYFCYGAIIRACLRRDFSYSWQVWKNLHQPFRFFEFAFRLIGVLLAPIVFLKIRWRRWEYRRLLGS